MPEQHAILSASSAHRWTQCPVSVVGDAGGDPNRAAAEGTLAHEIADHVLRGGDWPAEGSRREVEGFVFDITADFLKDVRAYVDFVQTRPWVAGYQPESQVNYSKLLGAPYHSAWGTTDCKGWTSDDKGRHVLTIIDLKFGRRAVSPVHNAQGLMYASGVLQEQNELNFVPRDTLVEIIIYQPRVSYAPATWVTTAGYVYDFVARQAEPAAAALRFYAKTDDAALQARFPENPGTHCTYCKRAKSCGALSTNMYIAGTLKPVTFDSELFKLRDVIRDTLDEIEAIAKEAALAGNPYKGTKLVETRGGNPALAVSEEYVLQLAKERGVTVQELKLLSPAKIRDAFKKAGVPAEDIAGLLTTPPKGCKIVGSDDPGKEVEVGGGFTGVDRIL